MPEWGESLSLRSGTLRLQRFSNCRIASCQTR